MKLRTLGGLELQGAHFTQPKPLLLLSYLSLEGSQPRRHLAELFWPTGNRMKSLSMTLTRLRQGVGDSVEIGEKRVSATLPSDVRELLESLDRGAWQQASELYTGAFLEGVVLEDWGSELEEWVYATREFLAERVQHGLLELSEDAARAGAYRDVQRLAERAYHLLGAPPTEVGALERHYRLLVAGESIFAPKAQRELESYGLKVALDTQTARAAFQPQPPAHALPLRSTSFVGRAAELLRLEQLLGQTECQLLTLLGSAGIGKTRLALEFAQICQHDTSRPCKVYFVALETARETTLPTQLALALGHTLSDTDDPEGELASLLGGEAMLVVLDNFEHLSGAAGLLSALVRRCPQLTLLVTSRVRLNLEEEYLLPLEGLAFPEALASADEATGFGAVQLFEQRARQLRPDFELAHELPAVRELCAFLGGSPLGLELAAGWVRFMPCSAIVAELRQNLDFLTSRTAGVPERHRSLRAAFDYSWQLLNSREQETLAALSVFEGGFTRQAASEVVGATIPLLVALLDSSLLRLLGSRFEQHPLIAHYAGEKLRAQEAHHETSCARHAAYFMGVARDLDAAVQAGRQDSALHELEVEWANIRAAFEYSLRHSEVTDLYRGLELLELLHDTRGSYTEALAFLERAEVLLRAQGPGARDALGGVHAKRAWFELRLGRYERARALVYEVLQTTGEASPWRISAYNTLSILERRTGAYREAQEACETGLALARRSQSELDVARMLASLADIEEALGNVRTSETYFLESIALYRRHNRVLGVVRNLNNLGWLYYVGRRFGEARTVFDEGLRLAREVGYRQTLPYLLNNLGYIALEDGRYRDAQRLNEEALELARANGERAVQAEILSSLARGELALGQPDRAAHYLDEGLRLAWDVAYVGLILQTLLVWGEFFCQTGEPEKAVTLAYTVLYHPSATEVEKARVAVLSGQLEAGLGPERTALAASRGREAVLEEVVRGLLEQLPKHAFPQS